MFSDNGGRYVARSPIRPNPRVQIVLEQQQLQWLVFAKRIMFKLTTARSFGVMSKSAAAFTSINPGFTKFACPSILLDRRLGNRLPSAPAPLPC